MLSENRRGRSGVPLETRVALLEEEMTHLSADLHSHMNGCSKLAERAIQRADSNRKWLLYIAAGIVLIMVEKTAALVGGIAGGWFH